MTLSDGRVVRYVSKESESLKEYLSVHEYRAIINIWSVSMCSVHVSKSEVSLSTRAVRAPARSVPKSHLTLNCECLVVMASSRTYERR
jgi:hypothetical protein